MCFRQQLAKLTTLLGWNLPLFLPSDITHWLIGILPHQSLLHSLCGFPSGLPSGEISLATLGVSSSDFWLCSLHGDHMECHDCKMQSTSGTSKLHLCVELLSGTSLTYIAAAWMSKGCCRFNRVKCRGRMKSLLLLNGYSSNSHLSKGHHHSHSFVL